MTHGILPANTHQKVTPKYEHGLSHVKWFLFILVHVKIYQN